MKTSVIEILMIPVCEMSYLRACRPPFATSVQNVQRIQRGLQPISETTNIVEIFLKILRNACLNSCHCS